MTLPKPWPSTPWHRLPSGHSLDNLDYRHHAEQSFVVMRHAERADSWGNDDWFRSEEFSRWPMDPPLSQEGIATARRTGQQLAADLGGVGGDRRPFTLVSSPFFRCVQTAVELCRGSGAGSKLLLDYELGEVFGPEFFGEVEPRCGMTRSKEEVLDYCRQNDVEVEVRCVGQSPQWPETLPGARLRFLCRFMHYLEEARIFKRNFALVTHLNCVVAALSAMPMMRRVSVASVDYGGYFMATARTSSTRRVTSSRLSPPRLMLADSASPGSEESEKCLKPQLSRMLKHSRTEGWVVEHFRVVVDRVESEPLTSRIRRWSRHSDFSEEHIKVLLKCSSLEANTDESRFWSNGTSSSTETSASTGTSSSMWGSSTSESTVTLGDSPTRLTSQSDDCISGFGHDAWQASSESQVARQEEAPRVVSDFESLESFNAPNLLVVARHGDFVAHLSEVKASTLMARRRRCREMEKSVTNSACC
mmetsp:Transcript_4994/g.11654  ORF Transcript_4994/g.11654 Transcript_4994/m.11654 type:complete len:475 (+) Transcript_4994:3-1427(+)